ncbi:MAG TPA: hypothetical protein VMV23_03740 [Candidatus Nanopelagicaceae bacterium]|nr:hypothetical protein [Candidatus Nanopelagicaceae bacterium]
MAPSFYRAGDTKTARTIDSVGLTGERGPEGRVASEFDDPGDLRRIAEPGFYSGHGLHSALPACPYRLLGRDSNSQLPHIAKAVPEWSLQDSRVLSI